MSRLNFLLVLAGIFCSNLAVAQTITISEINYKSAGSLDTKDWFELHNYGSNPVDITGWKISDSLGASPLFITSSTIMAPNSYLVFARNIGALVSFHPGLTTYATPYVFSLNTFDSLIVQDASLNVVVKAVINSTKDWPDGADGEGRTMELINHNSNIGLTLNTAWRDGCMLGSPGGAPVACNDKIIFSEVNYNNDVLKNIGEFVELYNSTNAAINVGGYYLSDGVDSVIAPHRFYIPAGTSIPAKGYIVLCEDTNALKAYKGTNPKFIGNFGAIFSLKNTGELLRLFDANNTLIFSMHYRDTIPWTDSADGMGYTLEIKDYLGRTNDSKNYFAGCLGGSPGGPYTPNCMPFIPIAVKNIEEQNVLVYPILATDKVYIENANDAFEKIYLIDASGRILSQQNINNNQNVFDISNFTSGVYYLKLTNANTYSITKKLIKF